jgi:hypothetical protein
VDWNQSGAGGCVGDFDGAADGDGDGPAPWGLMVDTMDKKEPWSRHTTRKVSISRAVYQPNRAGKGRAVKTANESG